MTTTDEALDGNSIAGTLVEVFGREMTVEVGVCAGCAARFVLAETAVYGGTHGSVMRCRHCTAVLLVITSIRGTYCVDTLGLAALGPAT